MFEPDNTTLPPQFDQPPTAQEIVRSMVMPGREGVFVLGCFESQVSIYNQQIRAWNLAYALHRSGYLEPTESLGACRIAVVGAGIAGLTAAATLSLCPSCHVTLIERESRPLTVIHPADGSGTRYLDPFLYEWPGLKLSTEAHGRSRDGLPLGSWRPGTQSEVVASILREWDESFARSVATVFDAWSVRLEQGEGVQLGWFPRGGGDRESRNFDLVVLALGFGLEQQSTPPTTPSYWAGDQVDDWIDVDRARLQRSPRYLVSGPGDGGWTDLFRLAIPGFRQQTMLCELLDRFVSSRTKRQLAVLEDRAIRLRAIGGDPSSMLTAAYTTVDDVRLRDALLDRVRHAYRGVCEPIVVLNAPRPDFATLQSFMVNRFLGSQLIRCSVSAQAGIVHLWAGHIARVRGSETVGFEVTLANGRQLAFDRVILRHGTNPALAAFDPPMFRAAEAVLRRVALVDRTRLPAWPPGYFQTAIGRRVWSIGTTEERLAEGERLEAYLNGVRRLARGDRVEAQIRAALASTLRPIDDAEDAGAGPAALRSVLEQASPEIAVDHWFESAANDWVAAIATYSLEGFELLGLDRPYLPLVVLADHVLDLHHRRPERSADEWIAAAVLQTLDLPFAADELVRRSRQTGLPWLVVVISHSDWQAEDRQTLLRTLRAQLCSADCRLLPVGRPFPRLHESVVYRFIPPSADNLRSAAFEGLGDGDRQRLRVKVDELFQREELTWRLLDACRHLLLGEGTVIGTRSEFVDAWLRSFTGRVQSAHTRCVAAMEAIAYQQLTAGTQTPRWQPVVARPDAEHALIAEGEDPEIVEELISAGALLELRLGQLLLPDAPPLKPFLSVPDPFLRVALACRHLAKRPDELLRLIRRSPSPPSWIAEAVIMDHEMGNRVALPELISRLGHERTRLMGRLFAEVLSRDVSLPRELAREAFQAMRNVLTADDVPLLGRLAGLDPDLQDSLEAIARSDRPDLVRVHAATALALAGRAANAAELLRGFADPEQGLEHGRVFAVRALRQIGQSEDAHEAATKLARAPSCSPTTRCDAAGEVAHSNPQLGCSLLREMARDRLLDASLRQRAADSLRRLGYVAEASAACWELLEDSDVPFGARSLESLRAMGEHLCQPKRLQSALEAHGRSAKNDDDQRQRAGAALHELVGVAASVPMWLAWLLDPTTSPGLRLHGAERALACGTADDESVFAALESLTTERADFKASVGAAELLSRRATDRPPSRPVLGSLRAIAQKAGVDADLRARAALTWGRLDPLQSPTGALLSLVAPGSDPALALACADCLRSVGSPSASRRLLLAVAHDPSASEQMRQEAVWGLGMSPHVPADLIVCLESGALPASLWTVVEMVLVEMAPTANRIDLMRWHARQRLPLDQAARRAYRAIRDRYPREAEELASMLDDADGMEAYAAALRADPSRDSRRITPP